MMLKSVTYVAVLVALLNGSASAAEPLSFNQDIRPILSEYCYACHGPDKNHREADLRLDDRGAAIEFGAIVPGDTSKSLIVERIQSSDPDLMMPPPDSGKKLSAEQKQKLMSWVEQGAEYQKHWSFEPVPDVVSVPAAEGEWPRNDVDRFVAQSLKEKGLTANVEASRATWLRRVTFDLTGLPPTLDELEAFEKDESPMAYEKVVERLQRSPAYGERMANMWLDVARYADTFGYQSDVEMDVWPWRDWVIRAFNSNMPYDQFLTEQIAGDMLPNATQDSRLATTFNRLHRQTNEGGSVPEEFRIAGIADRTTTAGTAFLGLTLECCRCHDHKFDPITQRDFYQLSAYFSDIDELGVYAHFTRGRPTPAMLLYEGDQLEKHEALKSEVHLAETEFKAVVAATSEHWRQRPDELIKELPDPREATLHVPLEGDVEGVVGKATKCNGDAEIKCSDNSDFGRTSPFALSLWVNPAIQQPRMIVLHQSVAAEDSAFRGLQLTIDDGHPEFSLIHFWPGNAVRVESHAAISVNEWTHIAITHDGSGQAAGLRMFINGQLAETNTERDGLTLDFRHRKEWGDSNARSVKLALGARFRDVGFRDGLVDDLRVFDVQLSRAEVASLYHSVKPDEVPATIDLDMAMDHQLLVHDEAVMAVRKKLEDVRNRENEFVSTIRQIMVMQRSELAQPTHILHRGEYTEPRDVVAAEVPQVLRDIPAEGEGRLALAHWMTNSRNPLTSRVIANRMWHLFFGRGIVVTLEDFGAQGSPPSHPELLDYLARYLVDNNWDLQKLQKQIVLSATYRQSSTVRHDEDYKRDPDNIWLSRGPKHRLSAEQLRDAALHASGLLVAKTGGPSVMPYQPEGLWREAGTGKTYHQSKGEGLYRRSLYTFWRRTAPPPSMLTFDATSRESCTARREVTTTPLQALVFLNDPQYVEASRVLAEKLVASHREDPSARWDELFRRLIGRQATDNERTVINELYGEQLAYFQTEATHVDEFLKVGDRPVAEGIDRADLAATAVVVQTVIAYDETVMLR
ncbi:MAG: DUF1553 domain-containing protein [Planctomycetaceae bacterium]